jgi:hypothetical protein
MLDKQSMLHLMVILMKMRPSLIHGMTTTEVRILFITKLKPESYISSSMERIRLTQNQKNLTDLKE